MQIEQKPIDGIQGLMERKKWKNNNKYRNAKNAEEIQILEQYHQLQEKLQPRKLMQAKIQLGKEEKNSKKKPFYKDDIPMESRNVFKYMSKQNSDIFMRQQQKSLQDYNKIKNVRKSEKQLNQIPKVQYKNVDDNLRHAVQNKFDRKQVQKLHRKFIIETLKSNYEKEKNNIQGGEEEAKKIYNHRLSQDLSQDLQKLQVLHKQMENEPIIEVEEDAQTVQKRRAESISSVDSQSDDQENNTSNLLNLKIKNSETYLGSQNDNSQILLPKQFNKNSISIQFDDGSEGQLTQRNHKKSQDTLEIFNNQINARMSQKLSNSQINSIDNIDNNLKSINRLSQYSLDLKNISSPNNNTNMSQKRLSSRKSDIKMRTSQNLQGSQINPSDGSLQYSSRSRMQTDKSGMLNKSQQNKDKEPMSPLRRRQLTQNFRANSHRKIKPQQEVNQGELNENEYNKGQMNYNNRRFTVFFQNKIFNSIDQGTKINEEIRNKLKNGFQLNPENYDQMKSISNEEQEKQLFEYFCQQNNIDICSILDVNEKYDIKELKQIQLLNEDQKYRKMNSEIYKNLNQNEIEQNILQRINELKPQDKKQAQLEASVKKKLQKKPNKPYNSIIFNKDSHIENEAYSKREHSIMEFLTHDVDPSLENLSNNYYEIKVNKCSRKDGCSRSVSTLPSQVQSPIKKYRNTPSKPLSSIGTSRNHSSNNLHISQNGFLSSRNLYQSSSNLKNYNSIGKNLNINNNNQQQISQQFEVNKDYFNQQPLSEFTKEFYEKKKNQQDIFEQKEKFMNFYKKCRQQSLQMSRDSQKLNKRVNDIQSDINEGYKHLELRSNPFVSQKSAEFQQFMQTNDFKQKMLNYVVDKVQDQDRKKILQKYNVKLQMNKVCKV